MERKILNVIYMVVAIVLLTHCGERDASVSILPTSQSYTLTREDAKKLQVVIVADPTKSMQATTNDLERYLPEFSNKLISSGFDLEIYCSIATYTGENFNEIKFIKSSDGVNNTQLKEFVASCVNVPPNDGLGDERGLEAARNTWQQIINNKLLDANAVKLTMIITNEDDCSRDLSKYPSNGHSDNICVDQNVKGGLIMPNDPKWNGQKSPMTDTAYADDPRLYKPERYVDFFNKNLKFVPTSKTESDQLLQQRGHIFAPVIMPPPAAVGKEKAEQCAQYKEQQANRSGAPRIMSYGMRYFQVAEASNNPIYSLCEKLENVLQEIHLNVQKEVENKQFSLQRKPLNPLDLKIDVTRTISDAERNTKLLQTMELENKKTDANHQWTLVKEEKVKGDSVKSSVTRQIWKRRLSTGNGFSYVPTTNEIIFDKNLYESGNDKLQVLQYDPALLDGEANYGS